MKITVPQIMRLADIHINRYQRRIASGSVNVRVSECVYLVKIWTHTKNCLTAHKPLPDDCRREIIDAVISGECPDIGEEVDSVEFPEE